MLYQVALTVAILSTSILYSAEVISLCCDEKMLQDPHILATHIRAWSDIITLGERKILSMPWHEDGTSVTYGRNAHFELRHRICYVGDTYHLKFEKRIGANGVISFDTRDKYFSAVSYGLEGIGTFLAPLYAVLIRSITLDDNKLTSFKEIQHILDICPVLINLSIAHNQFSNELTVHHLNLKRLDLSYNNFTKIKYIYLPVCCMLNLAVNPIESVAFDQIPKTMVPLLCNKIVWSFDAAQQRQCTEFVHSYYNAELCKVVPVSGTTTPVTWNIDELMNI